MSARDESAFVVVLKETDNVKPENPSRQVLLQLRKNTGLHDGKLVFPGGKRENDETLEAAACRELREETGLVVEEDRLLKLRGYAGRDPDGTQWQAMVYLCFLAPDCACEEEECVEKERNKHEIQWHPLDNLLKKKMMKKKMAPLKVRKVFSELDKFLKDPPNPKARKIVDEWLRNTNSDIKKNKAS